MLGFKVHYLHTTEPPWWCSSKESACQCSRLRRCGFNPWVGKILWRREWQPTPVFLPGESAWTEEPGGLHSMRLQITFWTWLSDWATAHSKSHPSHKTQSFWIASLFYFIKRNYHSLKCSCLLICLAYVFFFPLEISFTNRDFFLYLKHVRHGCHKV